VDFDSVIKGALLHDIGKFVMGAEPGTGINYQEKGAIWLEAHGVPDTISVFAARHHHIKGQHSKHDELDVFALPSNEILIVYEADNLSSGERPQKDGQVNWQADIPLMSVFSKISLDNRPGKPAFRDCWSYHELGEAGKPLRFPKSYVAARESYGVQGYRSLMKRFEEDFSKLIPELSIEALMVLLEKYTSYIPSETEIVEQSQKSSPDVSLFDHLKTTAAIAACLYRYLEETRPDFRESYLKDVILDKQDQRYMLVGGDFSGVQKFIYTISSKGALKTLRARSFFLELLAEHVVSKLLEEMRLPRANVIYNGGGRFYLLAPNTPGCREVLERVSLEINSLLYSAYRGQLYLIMDKVEFAGESFTPTAKRKREKDTGKDIASLWGVLMESIRNKKSRKFLEQMTSEPDGFWEPLEPGEKPCGICHSDTVRLEPLYDIQEEEMIEVCPLCKQLFELGDVLPDIRFIAKCSNKPEQISFLEIGGTIYALCGSIDELERLDVTNTLVLNSWLISDYLLPGAVQMFSGNYASRRGHGYKGFDELAKEAVGADRIGILRMDVDNLGTIFTRGFPESERTFSRLSALSRSLTHFFKFHINEICQGKGDFVPLRLAPGEGGRNVTLVYAGGDDLFLVGSWHDVPEIAFDIAGCFKKYTGQNPDVTISGGVVVQDAKYPLYRLAELAGEAEDRAKDAGKDSISLFYTPAPDFTRDGRPFYAGTLRWEEAKRMLSEIVEPAVRELSKGIDNNRMEYWFSRSFLQRLTAVADIWRREGKLYLPRLAYMLAREGDRKELKNQHAWDTWKQKLYKIENLGYLRVAVTWMDLLSRRGAEDAGL
jgi:CRISPR-associated protein Csm1